MKSNSLLMEESALLNRLRVDRNCAESRYSVMKSNSLLMEGRLINGRHFSYESPAYPGCHRKNNECERIPVVANAPHRDGARDISRKPQGTRILD
jgi:hypothetical protein